MYKAQAEGEAKPGDSNEAPSPDKGSKGDDVQDVDFEEVKED